MPDVIIEVDLAECQDCVFNCNCCNCKATDEPKPSGVWFAGGAHEGCPLRSGDIIIKAKRI